ncbi:MAG: hypothetical protein OEY97_11150, partial [Nitrospirota bacterium]|nr:hypothetical protein [Nitrospirota bacterium]
MATARALAEDGVNVHVAAFNKTDPGLCSSRFTMVDLESTGGDPDQVLNWLIQYAGQLGNRPVVIPTSDTFALMLAQHRDRLLEVCRIWNTSYDQLNTIVSKERLYAVAEKSGVPVVPMIVAPGPEQLAGWCRKHPEPYFVKPYYEAVPGCALGMKNRIFDTSAELLDYVD